MSSTYRLGYKWGDYLVILASGLLTTACAPYPREVWTGSDECMYIGCETGGLIYYPHERPQDKNEPGENYQL